MRRAAFIFSPSLTNVQVRHGSKPSGWNPSDDNQIGHGPKNTLDLVENYYGRGEILNSVTQALLAMGKDVTHLIPAVLPPVDEYHILGREATIELADRAALKPGHRVIDVGSGLGGSVRYLASTLHIQAMGIDWTAEYIDTACALSNLVGLQG